MVCFYFRFYYCCEYDNILTKPNELFVLCMFSKYISLRHVQYFTIFSNLLFILLSLNIVHSNNIHLQMYYYIVKFVSFV